MNRNEFAERYRKWCKRHGYNSTSDKASEIYTTQDRIAMIPEDELTRQLNRQAITSLNTISKTVDRLKAEMLDLASLLSEYPVVMAMHGVGDSLGLQLMAEIGDATRFAYWGSITSFAGITPSEVKSVLVSKSGPPELRRALFLVMDCLLKTMPRTTQCTSPWQRNVPKANLIWSI